VDKGKKAQIAQRPGIKGDEKTMESWRCVPASYGDAKLNIVTLKSSLAICQQMGGLGSTIHAPLAI
jgi:hypothetical protein